MNRCYYGIVGLMLASAGSVCCAQVLPQMVRIDGNYQPDEQGAYLWVDNETLGGTNAAFAVEVNGQRRRIPMADPTILKIGDTYYVTGSSDATYGTNFAIYKSTNLVVWEPHMLAFEPKNANGIVATNAWSLSMTGGSSGFITAGVYPDQDTLEPARKLIYIGGVQYSDLISPQLYIDPTEPTIVYLTFSAARGPRVNFPANCGSSTTPAVPFAPNSERPPSSCYVVSMSLQDFVNGGGFGQSVFFGGGMEPTKYGYTVNNGTGPVVFDGGYAQSIASPPWRPLASTIDMTLLRCGNSPGQGDCPGVVRTGNRSYGHACSGTASAMGIDPFVFFDPVSNNRRWMTYTWFGGRARYGENWPSGTDLNEVSSYVWTGNHITGVEMRTNSLVDATSNLRPLAYRISAFYTPVQDTQDPMTTANGQPRPQNTFGYPNTPIPGESYQVNGVIAPNGRRWMAHLDRTETPFTLNASKLAGIAEGSAAIRYGARTYFTFSRNFWQSASYGIWYRSTSGAFTDIIMKDQYGNDAPYNYTYPESPLVRSNNRSGFGRSFGHGELFVGPQGRLYLVMHGKGEASTQTQDALAIETNPFSVNLDYPGRQFTGRTVYFKEVTIQIDGSLLEMTDASGIGGHSVLGFAIPVFFCDSIDFNNDGLFPDDEDLADFLRLLAGGSCSTGNCNDLDFNNDGISPDDADLVAFLSAQGGGACP